MGLMRFLVHPAGSVSEDAANRAYLSGPDLIPWASLNHIAPDELLIERGTSDSANLRIPWHVDGPGELTLATSTLMEREAPYLLPLELARGKVQQVRAQLADWQQMGLNVPQPVAAKVRAAIERLARAACQQDDHDRAVELAQEAIVAAVEAGQAVGACYAEQALAVRRRQTNRLPTVLGVNLGETTLPPATAKLIRSTFNAVNVSLSWRRIEAQEGQYDWDLYDRQIEWCAAQGLQVFAGPLLKLDALGLPDWLTLWEGDFDNLVSLVTDFVETAVNRYQGKVSAWYCASRINGSQVLSLSEEDKLRLAVAAIEAVDRIDGATPPVLCFDQPWAEYLRRRRTEMAPLQLADALARSGLRLGGIGLELNVGYAPGGSYLHDVLDFSRLMDLWSMLGTPLYPSLCFASGDGPDAHARGAARPFSDKNGDAWTPQRQQQWASRIVPLLLAKPSVRGVFWNQLSDAVPHEFPHGGLFDTTGHPKSTLDTLAALRKQHLQ